MNTECPQMIGRGLDGLHTAIHTKVPKFHFPTTTSAHELTLSTPLQVNIGDPLLVFFPDFDHCGGGFLTLIVHANGTVAEAGHEYVTFNLI